MKIVITDKMYKFECMFKKEDEKDQEVRGGAVLSTGAYAVNT
ncbi:hypothetical protein V7112_20525 [Bacillus sp. JJ1566]